MNFEEFEKASDGKLREHARDCFERAQSNDVIIGVKTGLLQEAQFYLGAIERRDSAKIAKRDMRLELVVIALIGLEIVLSIFGIWKASKEGAAQAAILERQVKTLERVENNAVIQGKSDKDLMDKQNTILGNLQSASDGTTKAMKNLVATSERTAQTLQSLQSTTELMSKATQGQLELFYDVSLIVRWDAELKKLVITNTGRTTVTLDSVIISGPVAFPPDNVLTPNATLAVSLTYLDDAIASLPKGQSKSFPISLNLKNAKSDEFVLVQNIDLVWESDKVVVRTQTRSIRPQKWSAGIK